MNIDRKEFVSIFGLGQRVNYEDEHGFTGSGQITAVRFTRSKVYYEIVSDYTGKIDEVISDKMLKSFRP